MNDPRIEAATKEEWAERCFWAEAQRDVQAATIKTLVEALRLADAALSGANMNIAVVEQKVSAALAAAKETT
jgi:hypothetical protein